MFRHQTAALKQYLPLLAIALFTAFSMTGSFAQTTNTTPGAKAKPAASVDVNSADSKTLQTLPGIGSATAKRIIDGRPYQTVADLAKVKGLTAAKLNAIKDRLVFGPAVTAPSTNAAVPAKVKVAATNAVTGRTATPKAAASTLAPGQMVNINTASAADLDKVPGIGPVKAQAMVHYRAQNGNFKTIEDIQKVKGIKSATFAKIKAYIKVND